MEYVPIEAREKLILEWHEQLCHVGWYKCLSKMKQLYFWIGMACTVERIVKSCEICKATKIRVSKNKVPMGLEKPAKYPFQILAIDHFCLLVKSRKGNQWLLVVVDVFSKFILLKPTRDGKAPSVVKFLEEEVFFKYGVPEILISDNAKAFMGKIMVELLNKYQVRHWSNAYYHSQSNTAERYIQTVTTALRSMIFMKCGKQTLWDENIPLIQCALNSTANFVTQKSPFFINFGREMIFSGNEYRAIVQGESRENMTKDQMHVLFDAYREEISENLHKAYERSKKKYDLKTKYMKFQIGDKVWRKNFVKSDALKLVSAKCEVKYIPCLINKKLGSDTYEVKDIDGDYVGKYHANDLYRD